MKKTENYELNKPEASDFYNIEHFNENADIIDAMLKASQDHRENTNNPHNITKSQIGLNNVDNTSDANKPVSTAQQTAINEVKTMATNAQNTANSRATYEAGTFNLTIETYTSDTLYYVKIGKLVLVYGNTQFRSISGSASWASGGASFKGMPFSAYAGNVSYFWMGTNASSIPSNQVTSGWTLNVSGSTIKVTQSLTLTSGMPVQLFGIYLTN